MRWTVGTIQAIEYGPSLRHGFAFSVLGPDGMPLLTLSYPSEAEATLAQEAMRKAVETAADVTAP
jgi:hypothetical protein